jgi:hypothetical protein
MEKLKAFVKKHKKAIIVLGAVIVLGLLLMAGNNVLSPFNE